MNGDFTMWRSIGFIYLVLFSASSYSASEFLTASVSKTLIDDSDYGGCMAKLSPIPSSVGLNCGSSGWVTFSCTGDFNAKEVGNQKFEAAQLAMITGTRVLVRVFDTKKHNGYCYASRIDNRSD